MTLSNAQMRDVTSILHPYTNLVKHRETGPVIFERGKGVFVYDDHGKDYIEGMSGLWCTSLGWGDAVLADVAADVRKQCRAVQAFRSDRSGPFARSPRSPGRAIQRRRCPQVQLHPNQPPSHRPGSGYRGNARRVPRLRKDRSRRPSASRSRARRARERRSQKIRFRLSHKGPPHDRPAMPGRDIRGCKKQHRSRGSSGSRCHVLKTAPLPQRE